VQIPYFWAGIKAYDLVSGVDCLKSSYFINKGREAARPEKVYYHSTERKVYNFKQNLFND
jgi:hypothetical protein